MESRNVFDKIALGVISRLEGIDDVLNVGILKLSFICNFINFL
jgi:hypothetical protein